MKAPVLLLLEIGFTFTIYNKKENYNPILSEYVLISGNKETSRIKPSKIKGIYTLTTTNPTIARTFISFLSSISNSNTDYQIINKETKFGRIADTLIISYTKQIITPDNSMHYSSSVLKTRKYSHIIIDTNNKKNTLQ